jgi:hypothetical protein
MHPFPSSDRLQFLLAEEARLTQIVINPYGLVLTMDNGCTIAVEHAISYRTADGVETTYSAEWRNETPITFHALLEQRLLAVTTEEWRLTLGFEGGVTLVVHSSEDGYEAGQITGDPSNLLIVF